MDNNKDRDYKFNHFENDQDVNTSFNEDSYQNLISAFCNKKKFNGDCVMPTGENLQSLSLVKDLNADRECETQDQLLEPFSCDDDIKPNNDNGCGLKLRQSDRTSLEERKRAKKDCCSSDDRRMPKRPCADEQKLIVRALKSQSEALGNVLSDKVYILCASWWKIWCNYVRFDEAFMGADSFAAEPPPINNYSLKREGCEFVEDDEMGAPLAAGLEDSERIIAIPEEVWPPLVSWYGGGPAIARYVTKQTSGTLRIELYPEIAVLERSNLLGTTCVSCGMECSLQCSKCRVATYCSTGCQRAHSAFHACIDGKYRKGGKKEISQRGIVGLANLGNTCFMNSALQCLSHTKPLTLHFLKNKYQEDINRENPLGTGGKLAVAYGELLQELWFSHKTAVAPRDLKTAIARFAPQFSGSQQQDSQELLAYLLDGLHEDLNRVKIKPYVEAKETDGCDDEAASKEFWSLHLDRNKSVLVDHMQGQFKSTVVCPVCQKVSITFDPFNCIQLELPLQTKRIINVIVKRCSINSYPTRYSITLEKSESLSTLKMEVIKISGIPDTHDVLFADVYNSQIYESFPEDCLISKIRDDGDLVAYEVPTLENHLRVILQHRSCLVGYFKKMQWIGIPLLICIPEYYTCTQLFDEINKYTSHFKRKKRSIATEGDLDDDDAFEIFVVENSPVKYKATRELSLDLKTSSNLVSTIFRDQENRVSCFQLVLHWKENCFDEVNLRKIIDTTNSASLQRISITLNDCFQKFTQPELLDKDNLWYCSKCKQHRQATKTMQLWKIPDILILSLKRFEYRNSLFRDKLETFVDFPLDGLDMSSYCVVVKDSMLYDLYAVVNHYGNMGFGHYTAYANSWEKKSNHWFHFDDGNVSRIEPYKIISNAAYILFYRRRGT